MKFVAHLHVRTCSIHPPEGPGAGGGPCWNPQKSSRASLPWKSAQLLTLADTSDSPLPASIPV